MPRKKLSTKDSATAASKAPEAPVTQAEATTFAAATVAESVASAQAADEAGKGPATDNKGWVTPYIPIFVCQDKGFEMGENRRFKQRVFLFKEKPGEEVLAALKEHGFVYRAAEMAWTIPATAENRVLSDRLAHEFAGRDQGVSR